MSIGIPMKRKQPGNSRKKAPAPAKAAREGKKTKKTTRRTAEEQAAYDRTMASLDKIIGKNAEDALKELEEEDEEDNRPRTRGRNKKKL